MRQEDHPGPHRAVDNRVSFCWLDLEAQCPELSPPCLFSISLALCKILSKDARIGAIHGATRHPGAVRQGLAATSGTASSADRRHCCPKAPALRSSFLIPTNSRGAIWCHPRHVQIDSPHDSAAARLCRYPAGGLFHWRPSAEPACMAARRPSRVPSRPACADCPPWPRRPRTSERCREPARRRPPLPRHAPFSPKTSRLPFAARGPGMSFRPASAHVTEAPEPGWTTATRPPPVSRSTHRGDGQTCPSGAGGPSSRSAEAPEAPLPCPPRSFFFSFSRMLLPWRRSSRPLGSRRTGMADRRKPTPFNRDAGSLATPDPMR